MEKKKRCWLGLSLVPGLGPVTLSRMLEVEPDPERIWNAGEGRLKKLTGDGDLAGAVVSTREEVDLEARLQELEDAGLKFVTPADEGYPLALKEIYDPPPVLYIKGSLEAEFPGVALVGSRRSTRYGEKVAFELACELVKRGVVIVSGLALGIDRNSHLGAIKCGGRTVGVLGSGHDFNYPYQNSDLYRQIPDRGAVISEFWLDMPPRAGNFPRRNRIISGLCQGVVVVEAAERSGALITANLALDQNRQVFAVPGNIDRPNSVGCNNLIREGAVPVTSAADIISHLYSQLESAEGEESVIIPPDLTPLEKEIIRIFNRERELVLEELISLTGREAGEISTVLLKLEMKGLLSRRAGGKYYFEGLQTLLKPI